MKTVGTVCFERHEHTRREPETQPRKRACQTREAWLLRTQRSVRPCRSSARGGPAGRGQGHQLCQALECRGWTRTVAQDAPRSLEWRFLFCFPQHFVQRQRGRGWGAGTQGPAARAPQLFNSSSCTGLWVGSQLHCLRLSLLGRRVEIQNTAQ